MKVNTQFRNRYQQLSTEDAEKKIEALCGFSKT